MSGRDFGEYAALRRLRRREIVVAEWRIGDDRNAVLFAPRNHGVLDRALLEMIEHLIADNALTVRGLHPIDFLEIVGVEIADAP